jgi:hypothetical protein
MLRINIEAKVCRSGTGIGDRSRATRARRFSRVLGMKPMRPFPSKIKELGCFDGKVSDLVVTLARYFVDCSIMRCDYRAA